MGKLKELIGFSKKEACLVSRGQVRCWTVQDRTPVLSARASRAFGLGKN